jgi:hypothetical protein
MVLKVCDDGISVQLLSYWTLSNVVFFTYNTTFLNPFKTESESESESQLLYDWRFTAHQFVLATSPLRLTTSNFIIQLNPCGYSPYLISSLTRGWVCRLQLLLVLASASNSQVRVPRDSWPPFTVSGSRLPNLEGQVPVFISPRNRVTRLYPQELGSLFVASYDSQGYGGGILLRLHINIQFVHHRKHTMSPLQSSTG